MAAFTNTTIIADQADPLGFMGANVSAAFTVATMGDLVGVYTEAFLCALVEYDIVTNWATLNAVYKLMFSEYACRAIAVEAIKYNMSDGTTFASRIEAEDMINVHLKKMDEIKKLLEKASVQDFMGV